MARAMWTGALSVGLVTVPVGLYAATEDHAAHFRQIQRGTSDRVRNRRTNERTGEEVDFQDIVKGYDLGDDQYVVIEPGELEEIAPGRSRVIEVSAFVDLAEVDPIYFQSCYYLAPRGKEFTPVYGLLLEALEDSGRAAVATFVMRGKQYLTAVRPNGRVLELHTLHYADEIRDPVEDLPSLPERSTADPGQLKAARQLIDALTTEWRPEDYHDAYRDRVAELIDSKRAGQQIVTAAPAPDATNVIDLLEALRRSLDRAGTAPAADGGQAAEAPRRRTAPKADRTTARDTHAAHTARDVHADLGALSKAELYARASELDLPGRSRMSREELVEALGRAERPRPRRKAVA